MKTENILTLLAFNGVKTSKVVANETGSVILISIEKGKELAAHKSNTDASILILEGEVLFKIKGEEYPLKVHDMFSFNKAETHAIEAVSDAKLILIK